MNKYPRIVIAKNEGMGAEQRFCEIYPGSEFDPRFLSGDPNDEENWYDERDLTNIVPIEEAWANLPEVECEQLANGKWEVSIGQQKFISTATASDLHKSAEEGLQFARKIKAAAIVVENAEILISANGALESVSGCPTLSDLKAIEKAIDSDAKLTMLSDKIEALEDFICQVQEALAWATVNAEESTLESLIHREYVAILSKALGKKVD